MHIIYISHYLHEFDNDKLISNHFFFTHIVRTQLCVNTHRNQRIAENDQLSQIINSL